MFCPNCGNSCPDNVSTCPTCGHAFPQAQQAPQQPVYEQAPQQPYGQAPYGQAPQQPYGQEPYGMPTQPKNNTVVLVLGIVALVLNTVGCLCFSGSIYVGITCAIIAIILGIKAKKELAPGTEDKNVKTGLILSYIALGFGILTFILSIVGAGLAIAGGLLDSMY